MSRKPKWQKWRHMPELTLLQAVALSLDVDPDSVNHSYSWKAEADILQESQEFVDRLEIMKANLSKAPELTPTSVSLADPFGSTISFASLGTWVKRVNWKVPDELFEIFNAQMNTRRVSDWRKWIADRELWTLVEAAYLLLGLEAPSRTSTVIDDGSREANMFRRLKDSVVLHDHTGDGLLAMPAPSGLVGDRRVRIHDCLQWARERDVDLPRPLAELRPLNMGRSTAEINNKEAPEAEVSQRELGTLYKLILGMAIANYRFNPTDAKSGAPKAIATDLESVGLNVGDETVRKWLKACAARLGYTDVPKG